ncbi:hypothetical protein HDU79_008316 [Rhizoclosmatium sp. JEL0117]|nr:hypothetical protein HDU79_008316 [Rhizoclosmatium sp. JEL0117]
MLADSSGNRIEVSTHGSMCKGCKTAIPVGDVRFGKVTGWKVGDYPLTTFCLLINDRQCLPCVGLKAVENAEVRYGSIEQIDGLSSLSIDLRETVVEAFRAVKSKAAKKRKTVEEEGSPSKESPSKKHKRTKKKKAAKAAE